jgi:hypothetical protein
MFPLRSPVLSSSMPRDFITYPTCLKRSWGSPVTYVSGASSSMWRPLKREHGGDVKMPELLGRLVADCPRGQQKAFSVYDRCRAVYDRASLYS